MHRSPILLLAVAALAGCPETEDACPAGTVLVGDACVTITDAGSDDAGEEDAAPPPVDAGPCGGACTGATPICRDDTCVECLDDSDCTDPAAPRCDTGPGTCGACDADTQCERFTDTVLCAPDGPNAGSCVECTAADASACGTTPCTAQNTCSEWAVDSQAPCEPCDTDDNCAFPEFLCVPMEYPAGTPRDGGYCLKTTPGCTQPYAIVITGRETLSGVTGMSFCGINEELTTCEAVHALRDNVMCPGGNDDACPEGGICRTLDPTGAALPERCTYLCSGAVQCDNPPNPGASCNTYCGG